MATYESLLPQVKDEVQGAPDFHLEDAVRNAVIDLLKDSGLYRTSLSMTLEDGKTDYEAADLDPPSGTRIDHYVKGWYGNRELMAAGFEDVLARPSSSGPPRYFAPLPDHNGFRVWPEPTSAETDTLKFLVTLLPERDSSEFPDWLADGYEDAIVLRAKYRLMRVGGQPWSNPELADLRLRQYLAKLTEAKRNAFNSRHNNTQVQMRPWV